MKLNDGILWLVEALNNLFFAGLFGICLGSFALLGIVEAVGGFLSMVFLLTLGAMGYDEQVPESRWLIRVPGYVLGGLVIFHLVTAGFPAPTLLVIAAGSVALIETGYNAHRRYRNEKQPFQKYDWWPRNPLLFFTIPFRAVKAGYNKYMK